MKRRTSRNRPLLALIALLALLSVSCNLVSRFTGKAKETAEAAVETVQSAAQEATATPASQPADTPTSTPQAESAPPATGGQETVASSNTVTRPADGMVMIHIPPGEFTMGADKPPALPNERPVHTVFLDEYWIDQTEVTNAQYRLCLAAGICRQPIGWADASYAAGYAGDDQPAVGVTWLHAQAYCLWAGARLPSEAEWEKAARGTDGRSYAWGNARPDGSQANMSGENDPFQDTAPVGSFPAGASPYGVLDMTGNAREWVVDWYAEEYYATSPANNPFGPESGEMDRRVSRGGSFAESDHHSRVTDRMPQKVELEPKVAPFMLGFRCAASVPPSGETAAAPAPGTQPEPTSTPTPEAEGSAEQPAAPEGGAGPVEMTGLDNLHSYRGEWTTKVQLGAESGMAMRYRLEWTKEPSAQHVWVDTGMAPFAESIWIEDEVWVKMGDQWVKSENEEAKQAFEDFHSAFDVDEDMILVGEETVNGVRCKHYVDDFVGPNQAVKMHREVWVADQGDLPQVPVRAIFRMENKSAQDTMITEIEANLHDINTPIEIKAPQ